MTVHRHAADCGEATPPSAPRNFQQRGRRVQAPGHNTEHFPVWTASLQPNQHVPCKGPCSDYRNGKQTVCLLALCSSGRLGEQKPLPEQCLAGPLCVHQCGSALDTTALVIPASSEMGGDQPIPRKTSVAMSLGLRRTSRKAQTLGEAQDLPAFLRAEMLFNSFKAAMINGTATGPSKGR